MEPQKRQISISELGTEFIVESEESPMIIKGEAVNVEKELANPWPI